MGNDSIGLGKAADAIERGTRELRTLVQDLLSPAAKEVGAYLSDRVRIYRYEATIRAIRRANEKIDDSGLDLHPIDLKRLIPLLEGASLEEHGDLVEKWAGLIASAATTTDVLPAFAEILRQLTPEEAQMLDYLEVHCDSNSGFSWHGGVDKEELEKSFALDEEQFLIRIQNLHRLELIVQLTIGDLQPARGSAGWSRTGNVGLTALGAAFIRACKGPPIEHAAEGT